MKLSIIIPVYNVEKYIHKCLESVLNQNTEDYEVILVDDGSPDNCPKICDEYARRYDNISVIHQENAGLSQARNAGIEAAKGDYIVFLDSDDWIVDGCLNIFISVADEYKPDIIVGKARTIDDSGNIKDKKQYNLAKGLYSIDEYLELLKLKRNYIACAPFNIYNRIFLNDHHLRFMPGVLHEDELWTPSVFCKAKSVYYTDEFFYMNYIRMGSISHSGNKEREGRNLLVVCKCLLEVLSQCPRDDIEVYKDKLVFTYLRAICLVSDFSEEAKVFTPKLLRSYAYFSSTRYKALLYSISPKLYLFVHRIVKG